MLGSVKTYSRYEVICLSLLMLVGFIPHLVPASALSKPFDGDRHFDDSPGDNIKKVEGESYQINAGRPASERQLLGLFHGRPEILKNTQQAEELDPLREKTKSNAIYNGISNKLHPAKQDLRTKLLLNARLLENGLLAQQQPRQLRLNHRQLLDSNNDEDYGAARRYRLRDSLADRRLPTDLAKRRYFQPPPGFHAIRG